MNSYRLLTCRVADPPAGEFGDKDATKNGPQCINMHTGGLLFLLKAESAVQWCLLGRTRKHNVALALSYPGH